MQNDNIKEDQLFSLAGQSNERVFSVIRALSWFGLLHAILCTLLWKNEIQWWLPTLPFCVPLGMLICVHRPDHRDWGHWGYWCVCVCVLGVLVSDGSHGKAHKLKHSVDHEGFSRLLLPCAHKHTYSMPGWCTEGMTAYLCINVKGVQAPTRPIRPITCLNPCSMNHHFIQRRL